MKKVLVVVLILAAYAIGQAPKSPVAKTPKVPIAQAETGAIQTSHVGRYQMFFSPHARADVYLVDTETGKIWKPITITNATDTNLKGAPEVWVYQDRVDNEPEFNVWMLLHQPPASATPPQ
ncbi:MAG: hypothetical protein WBM11_12735 [Terriglobales bacterium]